LPFSGGGGSGAITNHVHNNLANEGGSLSSESTLVSDTPLLGMMMTLG